LGVGYEYTATTVVDVGTLADSRTGSGVGTATDEGVVLVTGRGRRTRAGNSIGDGIGTRKCWRRTTARGRSTVVVCSGAVAGTGTVVVARWARASSCTASYFVFDFAVGTAYVVDGLCPILRTKWTSFIKQIIALT
jgi:hypothetical protein